MKVCANSVVVAWIRLPSILSKDCIVVGPAEFDFADQNEGHRQVIANVLAENKFSELPWLLCLAMPLEHLFSSIDEFGTLEWESNQRGLQARGAGERSGDAKA